MFVMVTFIATLIHSSRSATWRTNCSRRSRTTRSTPTHGHLHRRGRFGRFFMYPVAVLLLDAQPGPGRQPLPGVRELGAGRHLLVLADRLLLRAAKRLERGQQGVHHQPRRRRRLHHRPADHLDLRRHVQLRGDLPAGPRPAADAARRRYGRRASAGPIDPRRPPRPTMPGYNDDHDRPGRDVRAVPASTRRPHYHGVGPDAATTASTPCRGNAGRDEVSARCPTGCWSSPGSASSWAASASRPSSRCTSGCPTRWKARRRSAP